MPPLDATNFWTPWAREVSSYVELRDAIDLVESKTKSRQVVWRGQMSIAWPLHSSLYRRAYWTALSVRGRVPQEREISQYEQEIFDRAKTWGLHFRDCGALKFLYLQAILQHYGSPTRLIDVSYNAMIGAWFAVEQRIEDCEPKFDDQDGLLLAFDVEGKSMDESGETKNHDQYDHVPWHQEYRHEGRASEMLIAWSSDYIAWRPSQFHPRMSAQNGGFLIGGVPQTQTNGEGKYQLLTAPGSNEKWLIDDVRQFTSIAIRLNLLDAERGKKPSNAVYAIKINRNAKPEIRENLQAIHGYDYDTIYPDYPGFADFGHPDLRQTPPR